MSRIERVFSLIFLPGIYPDWLLWIVYTADRLAQLVEHRTTVREVVGSNPGRTNTQGL